MPDDLRETAPSPYVWLYMSRRQAELAVKQLRKDVEGKADSNPLWLVIRNLEKALVRDA